MKFLFVLGSRGEWGYIRPIIRDCIKRSIEYSICATNMVLLSENGLLVNEIEQEGFFIGSKVLMSLEGSTNYSMAKSVGLFASSFVDILMQEKPDWTILAGDRGEQLAAALACSYSYIPCAHIQAGERSGNIDGIARHAIGKLVHLHFAANSDASERLKRLGEQEFRVHNVGAPQLDEIYSEDLHDIDFVEKELNISLKNGFLLIVQHPVTEQLKMASENTSQLLKALEKFSLPKIIILPNNDAGSTLVKEKIFASRRTDMHIFSNLTRKIYLSLLRECSCIVGNSSSGLLEAPSFRTPAVNIGIRQQGRVQGENVINCEYNIESIIQSINKALSENFKNGLASSKNPYGDGKSSKRIIDLLSSTKVDDNLLIKEITS
tara:strand:- start:5905 stop:7038 length:1134 start_codon:yes stop_codon:yes gene_type:complete